MYMGSLKETGGKVLTWLERLELASKQAQGAIKGAAAGSKIEPQRAWLVPVLAAGATALVVFLIMSRRKK